MNDEAPGHIAVLAESSVPGLVVFFSGFTPISLDTVLLFLKIFFGLSVFLVLYVIYLRGAQILSEGRRKYLMEKWEPLLLDYMNGSLSLEDAVREMGFRDYDLLGEILIEYSQDIMGQALERMVVLWRRLGFDVYSMERLKSRSAWRRAYGVTMLGIMRDIRAVPILIELLNDTSPVVTFAAARAIARIGVKRELSKILDIVATSKSWSEDQFAEIILNFGPDIADDLARLCEDPKVPLNRLGFIIDVLGFLRFQPAYPVLAKLAEKGEKEIRIRSIKALGEIALPECFQFLLGLLRDENWEVRSQVAKAAGKLGHERAIPKLLAVLDDEVWWVRFNAAVALAKLGDKGISALRHTAHHAKSRRARKVAQHVLEQHIVSVGNRAS